MKFELNPLDESLLIEPLRPAGHAWQARYAIRALRELQRVGRRKSAEFRECPTSENDWLFAIDVLNSCGLFNHTKRLTQIALQQHPDSAWLQMLEIWDVSANGRLFECQRRLDHLSPQWPADFAPLRLALQTYNYSYSGWRSSAARAHGDAERENPGTPLFAYILSRAASLRSEWELATQWGERALVLAPRWTRARATVLDSMIATGRLDRARQLIAECPADALPMVHFDLALAYVHQAAGEIGLAIDQLRRLLAAWPIRSRYQRFAASQLALWLMMEGQGDEAKQLAERFQLRRLDFPHEATPSRKTLINLPLVSQAHNHCVPTVAAMVAQAQGVAASPAEYAIGMQTADGTPFWRMIHYMKSQGFQAYCVRAELEPVQYLLDRGVPLIGSLVGLFSSHVDVICGYHEGLKLLHIRDPMHWINRSIMFDDLASKYEHSEGLWAFVPASRADTIELSEPWIDRVGAAMVDLAASCAAGDLATAEEAYRQIPDDHPLALQRDLTSVGIVITQRQLDQHLDKFAEWQDHPRLQHLQSMLIRINGQHAASIYQTVEERRAFFGERFADYIQTQCLMAQLKWSDADQRIQQVAETLPQLESMWRVYSEIKEQLGDSAQAIEAIHHAIDIAPEDYYLQVRLAELQAGAMPLRERLDKVERLLRQHPHRLRLYFTLADILGQLGDGLKYEEAMKKCIHFYPRDPIAYQQLASWYEYQGRLDLARPVLERGRSLVGEQELPKWSFEMEPPPEAEPTSEDGAHRSDVAAATSSAAPQAAAEATETAPFTPAATGDGAATDRAAETGDRAAMAEVAETARRTATADQIDEALTILATKSFAEACGTPAVERLLPLDQQGDLSWSASVRLRAALVGSALRDMEKEHLPIATRTAQLRQALPGRHMPGIPEIYAQQLFNLIDRYPISSTSAEILLDWLAEHCPDHAKRPELEFTRAWLLEKRGYLNEAETVHQQITERYPAYASSWYRLAQIAQSRNDFKSAYDLLLKTNELAPANEGALYFLAKLAQYARSNDEFHFRHLLAKLYPYNNYRRYEATLAKARVESLEAALDYLAEHREQIGADYPLLRGRVLADHNEFDRALAEIADFPESTDSRPILDWIRVDAMIGKRQFEPAVQLLDQMLQRNPNDELIADQLARALQEISPDKAKAFCRQKLLAGCAIPSLARLVLIDTPFRVDAAMNIVSQVNEEHQVAVATAIADAFDSNDWYQHLIPFLERIHREMPHMVALRERLAYRLQLVGQKKKAVAVADELLAADPDNPRWLKLAGFCVQDSNPAKSIEYLEKEFAITGDAESLCRLARGYQLHGEHKKAQETYFRTLEINPLDSLAITNLVHRYRIFRPELLDMSNRIIEIGQGSRDQYFLVVVIELAKRFKRQVPFAWYEAAVERFANLKIDGGFHDEADRLRRALRAWTAVHPSLGQSRTNIIARWLSRWYWPQWDWIPRVGSGESKRK